LRDENENEIGLMGGIIGETRQTESDRNGTKDSFMIYKEFALTNFPTVTSNLLARIFMLFEFFGFRFPHMRL